jgi:hypothetical protein
MMLLASCAIAGDPKNSKQAINGRNVARNGTREKFCFLAVSSSTLGLVWFSLLRVSLVYLEILTRLRMTTARSK